MENLFFIASKIIWTLIRPETLLLLLIAFALFAFWRNESQWGLVALTIVLGASLAIAIFPLGNLVLRPLEVRFPANPTLESIDGIIILGGAELATRSNYWRQPQLSSAAERLVEGVALAKRFPDARLVYSGGSGSMLGQPGTGSETGPGIGSGAAVAEQVFSELGIEKDRQLFEHHSRNTFENATRSYELIKPKQGERWVLITSASHMPRAVGVFCQIGWPVVTYPVDYRSGTFGEDIGWNFANNLDDLNTGVKEWLGLLAYRLTGKISSLLPGSC